MPDEELPFSPPIPRKRKNRKRRFPLLKAVWKSVCEGHAGPLAEHFGKEWRNLRKYPGILALTLAASVFVAWYCTRWWFVEKPYTGETTLQLFFAGDGGLPQTVSKANIYRAYTMEMVSQFTSPKSDKEVDVARTHVWVVGLIFDKEINAENSLLSVSGLDDAEMNMEIRDFTARSATIIISPKEPINQSRPGKPLNPKGFLDVHTIKRTASSATQMFMQPSPTPDKGVPSPTPTSTVYPETKTDSSDY